VLSDGLLHGRLDYASRFPALTASDPSWVFAIKSLLHPVVTVACLLGCMLAWRQPFYGPYFLLAVLAFFTAAEFLDVAETSRGTARRVPGSSILDLLLRWLLIVGFLYLVLHLSGVSERIRWKVLLTWAFVTPTALWLSEVWVHRILNRSASGRRQPRKAVILGMTEVGLRLKQQLEADPLLHIQVTGFFDERSPERLPLESSVLLGKQRELANYVQRENITLVYITLPMTPNPRMVQLLQALQDSTVSIYFAPDLFTFDLIQARVDVIGGMPIVAVRESPFYGARAIVKRLCDISVAVPILLLASPLLLFTALGVRLSSPGPVLFRQRRYGLDGRQIRIFKFRSMSVTEDGALNYTQVTRNDERVTRFGAFIRRTSLDELPQLFNVLAGSLSIVGPRPHAIAVNEQYRRLIPGYMFRHKVKPGITGWAQVNGCRGGDDLESMQKRIEFDIEYLRHWSLMLDLSIMLKTAATVWRDRRAY
jgi:putative colanic acid biosysnthesis UDP-glucose lipid carrier transferase